MDVEAARGHNMVEEILDIVVMSASRRGGRGREHLVVGQR